MKKKKSISYAKWGYIFILPFFITFLIFSLIPLVDTVRYSFYEYYRSGIKEIGPNFIGIANYLSLLKSDMLKYSANTLILWVIGFVPQIVIALVLENIHTDTHNSSHQHNCCITKPHQEVHKSDQRSGSDYRTQKIYRFFNPSQRHQNRVNRSVGREHGKEQ